MRTLSLLLAIMLGMQMGLLCGIRYAKGEKVYWEVNYEKDDGRGYHVESTDGSKQRFLMMYDMDAQESTQLSIPNTWQVINSGGSEKILYAVENEWAGTPRHGVSIIEYRDGEIIDIQSDILLPEYDRILAYINGSLYYITQQEGHIEKRFSLECISANGETIDFGMFLEQHFPAISNDGKVVLIEENYERVILKYGMGGKSMLCFHRKRSMRT